MCKNSVLLRDVIFPNDKEFAPGTQQHRNALKNPDVWGIERRIELLVARMSGGLFTFVDGNGYDNSDFTETKTSTLSRVDSINRRIRTDGFVSEKLQTRYSASITNVGGKIGALRVVIYNTINYAVDYVFVPKSEVIGARMKKKGGRATPKTYYYNIEFGCYTSDKIVIAKNLKELARIPADYEP
jgi:hypothetical protein